MLNRTSSIFYFNCNDAIYKIETNRVWTGVALVAGASMLVGNAGLTSLDGVGLIADGTCVTMQGVVLLMPWCDQYLSKLSSSFIDDRHRVQHEYLGVGCLLAISYNLQFVSLLLQYGLGARFHRRPSLADLM